MQIELEGKWHYWSFHFTKAKNVWSATKPKCKRPFLLDWSVNRYGSSNHWLGMDLPSPLVKLTWHVLPTGHFVT